MTAVTGRSNDPSTVPHAELADLARRFQFHATNAYRGASPDNASPLYEHLALGVSADPDVLTLVAGLDPQQQVANLLFGAVHFLLLRGSEHPLRAFYASCTPRPRPPHEAYPFFQAFCQEQRAPIRQLVTTRSVQTNEVGRCTSLLPAFSLVAARVLSQPLALIELGASAGLNLLWDVYGYDYGAAGRVGIPGSPVQLICTLRGAHRPPVPTAVPLVQHRVGVDLAPIDVRDPLATRWLRALIWPEHHERVQQLDAAVAVVRRTPPPLVADDLAAALPAVLAAVPDATTACVFHSYTLNHCPPQTRERVNMILAAAASDRPIFRIGLEYHAPREHPRLMLFTYHAGIVETEHLAWCESHGRWIEWLGPVDADARQ